MAEGQPEPQLQQVETVREQRRWVGKWEELKVCKQQRLEPEPWREGHSLGLQGRVQWSQPACWPSDWSSAAC